MSFDVCKRGHHDWVITKSGRRCAQCRRDYKRPDKKPKRAVAFSAAEGGKTNNKGSLVDDTFTYTEIMKARGYR